MGVVYIQAPRGRGAVQDDGARRALSLSDNLRSVVFVLEGLGLLLLLL